MGEEDTVPFYFEAYSSDLPEFVRSEIDDVTSNRDESKEDDSLVPPVEIVLPADVDPSTSYKSEFSKPNAELHSEASDLKKYSMW